MIMSAIRPDLPGPIVLAGVPLSYWAGVRGKNPMRYLGGLLGGTWLTALAGDLGNGIFDGAHLVANFESLHPSNTYWKKAYISIPRSIPRLPAILSSRNGGAVRCCSPRRRCRPSPISSLWGTSDLRRVSHGRRHPGRLRNIKSPIVVFCSWGDDITPPQQALGWILDLYETEQELAAAGQTIVYCSIKASGISEIFVSGKVATKEHGEFAQCMDMIDLLPPGLYEAVITGVDENTVNPELIRGEYLFAIEPRISNI